MATAHAKIEPGAVAVGSARRVRTIGPRPHVKFNVVLELKRLARQVAQRVGQSIRVCGGGGCAILCG